MAIHTCRDFLSLGNPLTMRCQYLGLYYTAIFMQVCLNYSVVGQTNFNLSGSTLRKATGTNGSLNQGVGYEYAFKPDGYSVSVSDLNRILCIKSPGFPMVNSGLFRVTGIDTANNYLYVNYRCGDIPPAETGMIWGLYESEPTFYNSVNFTGNGISGTYQGQGSATQSRIILQSPSLLGWQIRLTCENVSDTAFSGGSVTPYATSGGGSVTMAPGIGGNSAGDFQPGGQHLHVPLFFNKHNTDYQGSGISLFAYGAQCRFYMWGDDVNGTMTIAARNVVNSSDGGDDSWVQFGLCEDEELPLPPKSIQRLFIIGANIQGANGGSIVWNSGWSSSQGRGGISFGLSNQPISAAYSIYTPLASELFSPTNTSARNSLYAGDNPYIMATELLPVDVIAGTYDNMNSSATNAPEVLILEGRRLGRAPLVRMGRTNYGYFQLSTDPQHAWIHLGDGVYMPWQGSILP